MSVPAIFDAPTTENGYCTSEGPVTPEAARPSQRPPNEPESERRLGFMPKLIESEPSRPSPKRFSQRQPRGSHKKSRGPVLRSGAKISTRQRDKNSTRQREEVRVLGLEVALTLDARGSGPISDPHAFCRNKRPNSTERVRSTVERPTTGKLAREHEKADVGPSSETNSIGAAAHGSYLNLMTWSP